VRCRPGDGDPVPGFFLALGPHRHGVAHSRLAGWLTLAARRRLLARLASIAVNRFNAVIDVGRLTRVATPCLEVASGLRRLAQPAHR